MTGRGHPLWLPIWPGLLARFGARVLRRPLGGLARRERFFASLRMTTGTSMTAMGIALLLVVLPVLPGSASDATPAPFATDPAQCTIAPRTLDELERIMAGTTPVPERGRPISGDAIALEVSR